MNVNFLMLVWFLPLCCINIQKAQAEGLTKKKSFFSYMWYLENQFMETTYKLCKCVCQEEPGSIHTVMNTPLLCVFSFPIQGHWHKAFQWILAAYNTVYSSPIGIPIDHTCMRCILSSSFVFFVAVDIWTYVKRSAFSNTWYTTK